MGLDSIKTGTPNRPTYGLRHSLFAMWFSIRSLSAAMRLCDLYEAIPAFNIGLGYTVGLSLRLHSKYVGVNS